MITRVVVPPAPILTPADVPGSHASDDARVAARIAAATEELDGPTGWLGRAIGVQTLELSTECWMSDYQVELLYPPLISITSVKYVDEDGAEQTVSSGDYAIRGNLLWFGPDWSSPTVSSEYPEPIRIRYTAGYNGTAVASGGTGSVPQRIKQAIILAVQDALATGVDSLFLRSVEIPDVMTKTYTVSDQASKVIHQTTGRLLAGLRVFI